MDDYKEEQRITLSQEWHRSGESVYDEDGQTACNCFSIEIADRIVADHNIERGVSND